MVQREGHVLHIADVDLLDGTPLLDIKPHIARFGVDEPVRSGWQERISEPDAERLGRRDDTARDRAGPPDEASISEGC